ncbi:uncharacterized protein N7459_008829, partial [Penicillium hispanicum]|uniref:uncharacterized protein n=1 Tax=Penicillium hispanicum TaxID=1080232 RepID=UPI002540E157
HSNWRLKVTAGPDYDPATHQTVQVNSDTLQFDSDRATVNLNVSIQNYVGYPEGAPSTSNYFKHALHEHDKYSIAFSFVPKQDVNGNDLFFGNDFDHPIRDRLPMGFNMGLNIVKWTLDPNIHGDAYADEPYLYSPALATWNQFRIGDKNSPPGQALTKDHVVEEGAQGTEGPDIRSRFDIPSTAAARRKHFQKEEHRQAFDFEAGRMYMADFGNQFLNFSDLSVTLPGIEIPVHNLVDSENNQLRYVLKDTKTGRAYLVVLFTLVLGNQ